MDLQTIRLSCQKCRATTEAVTLEKATLAIQDGKFRHCGNFFYETRHGQKDLLAELDWVMRAFQEIQDRVTVEFVIPDDGQEGQP